MAPDFNEMFSFDVAYSALPNRMLQVGRPISVEIENGWPISVEIENGCPIRVEIENDPKKLLL